MKTEGFGFSGAAPLVAETTFFGMGASSTEGGTTGVSAPETGRGRTSRRRHIRNSSFGKYAGRAGFIDFLLGLGQRYLSLGYSTPFLSLGASYMYPSLAAAKAAVISVGEEIATLGLPSGICPLVFVFTSSGNVSSGAQEIFKLLPHTFVEPSELPALFGSVSSKTSTVHVVPTWSCMITIIEGKMHF
nr:alpha-aminoadipic semialdehyde synthase-like [Malus domestica]